MIPGRECIKFTRWGKLRLSIVISFDKIRYNIKKKTSKSVQRGKKIIRIISTKTPAKIKVTYDFSFS